MRHLKVTFTILIIFSLFVPSIISGVTSGENLDKLLHSLTLREKIAQLYICAFSTNPNDRSFYEIDNLIEKERIGGVILMESNLHQYVEKINKLRKISKVPLLISIDGEWGVAMRIDSVTAFPRQLQLGAMKNSPEVVEQMGSYIAEQCKRLGITLNYAPSIDINSNPLNSAINTRSFGENRLKVSDYGWAYYKGMRGEGVLGSAKHFPGHGDTDVDSHYDLPLLKFSKERLDSVELVPFKRMILSGAELVMIGHLQIPSLDSSGTPSSISRRIITDFLKNSLEYNGLIITDALNMKGVSVGRDKARLPLESLLAGADLILMPENVSESIDVIERAVKDGIISEHAINMRCRKVLKLKSEQNLLSDSWREIKRENILSDLSKSKYTYLNRTIADRSLILLKNRNNIIPLPISTKPTTLIAIGAERGGSKFASYLSRYSPIDTLVLDSKSSTSEIRNYITSKPNDINIIVSIHNTDQRPQKNYGLDNNTMSLLADLAKERKITLVYFGNPYAFREISKIDNFDAIICAFNSSDYNLDLASQKIFGASTFKGEMPVTSGNFLYGRGLDSDKSKVLSFNSTELYNVDGEKFFKELDKLITSENYDHQVSGSRLIALKDGVVFVDRCYGNMTSDDVVDLKSTSAAFTTLPLLLKLIDDGHLSLEDFVYKYYGKKAKEGYNQLISDLLVSDKSSDIKTLNKIISKFIKKNQEDSLYQNIYNPLGFGKYVLKEIGDNLIVNPIDIAKFLGMVQFAGEYSNTKVFTKNSADFMSNSLFYFNDREKKGQYLWYDATSGVAMIYFEKGYSGEKSGSINTGIKARRVLESAFIQKD